MEQWTSVVDDARAQIGARRLRRVCRDCARVARHGARSAEKFFLLWAATGELSHKPALPCAISAGEGGAYVISELRMSSYKNNRLCWLPEQLIARQVKSICNDDTAQMMRRFMTPSPPEVVTRLTCCSPMPKH